MRTKSKFASLIVFLVFLGISGLVFAENDAGVEKTTVIINDVTVEVPQRDIEELQAIYATLNMEFLTENEKELLESRKNELINSIAIAFSEQYPTLPPPDTESIEIGVENFLDSGILNAADEETGEYEELIVDRIENTKDEITEHLN